MEIAGAHVVFHKLLKTGKDGKCEKEKDGKCKQDAIQAILLCKRTQDAPVHPGYWSLFGGQVRVEDKEKPPDAVLREVKEELLREVSEELEITDSRCCPVEPTPEELESLCDVQIMRKKGQHLIKYFKASLDVDMHRLRLNWNEKENKVEAEALGWFTAEEVHHLMMRPEDRIAVTSFFRNDGV